jgi:hypothetical protein
MQAQVFAFNGKKENCQLGNFIVCMDFLRKSSIKSKYGKRRIYKTYKKTSKDISS